MKKLKSEPVYVCSVCGKAIAGDHVRIKRQGWPEQHIHYGRMPVRKGEDDERICD